jgi:serine/threonine protein kinase
MPIEPGTKLGRYEIRSQIGAGGMGEVYLARDPKIGRDVAIKVLPSALSDDKERLARFEQEAQAAGSLNHPNILAIYDVATDNGALYVVSELLEGETLRDMIGGTPLPVRKALNFGLQAAHGLAAAHEKGIIHRDLKPENLFVTLDGRLKILDFGLAKLTETNGDESKSDLPTRKVNTDAGAVMGTVGYMSPEQLRGKAVDQRTDIFSFGTVLYEMLSGHKAFQKEATADTISAILREDPPELSGTNKNVDPGLERVVHRCLEKNREQRFHSASDLAFALESLSGSQSRLDTSAIESSTFETRSRARALLANAGWIAAVLLLTSTSILAYLYYRRAPVSSDTFRFSITAPEKSTFTEAAALSPDGRQIAMIVTDAAGVTSLWTHALDSLEARRLTGTEGASFPFWSPDGKFIGFFASGKLKKIDSNGGPPQILADGSSDSRGGSWSADGAIIFSPTTTSPLLKVSSNGGPTSAVTNLDHSIRRTSDRWPQFLPDGKHFIYFGRGDDKETEGIYINSLDSMTPKLVLKTTTLARFMPSAAGGPDGELLFVRDGTLMSTHLNLSNFEVSGESTPIVQGVIAFPTEVGPTAFASFSTSDSGTLIYRIGNRLETQLTWFDRAGKSEEKIFEPATYHEPALSSDGKKLVLGEQDGGPQDLFMLDISRKSATRLTFDPKADNSAVFSPDGSQIIYASNRSGEFDFYEKPSNGSGADQLVLAGKSSQYPDSWSKDGKYLLYEVDDGNEYKFDLFILPLTGDRTPFPYVQTTFTETHAQFSPDGKWIAYVSDQNGKADVYVQSFPIGGGVWQVSTAGGDQPQWRTDGKELFYLAPDRNIMSVSVNTTNGMEFGRPEALFQANVPLTGLNDDRNSYVPTPDGQKFLVEQLTDSGNVQPWNVVINWNAAHKQ